MLLHQRIAGVVAREGFSGLWPRVRGRLLPTGANVRGANSDPQIVKDYYSSIDIFREKTRDIDVNGFNRFYWYHTIDLGDGLVTPGEFDHRPHFTDFDFPADMSDLTVLDVGSATGFFAFEFEKRGAEVTSIELPSLIDWDMPPNDREQTLSEIMQHHCAASLEETYYLHLDGPFLFSHERMRSKVARHYSTIYNLGSANLKHEQFDLVFLGDILLHLMSPFQALSVVARLCRQNLVVFQILPELDESQPLMLYTGGRSRKDESQGEARTWWLLNRTCLEQMLQRLGFRNVRFGARIETVHRPSGSVCPHMVVYAKRAI
jgi:2-polyprenyl-3-methyl-5-hydroxy-6-metoxy-1,4-benzoquinol methylase